MKGADIELAEVVLSAIGVSSIAFQLTSFEAMAMSGDARLRLIPGQAQFVNIFNGDIQALHN